MVMLIGAAFSEPDRRADGRGVQAWRDGRPSPQPVDRGAWASRGLRVPARNALLADVVSPQAYGRAYGFERFMDNLGAAGGPLLALGLVAAVGVRTSIWSQSFPVYSPRSRLSTRSGELLDRRCELASRSASKFVLSCVVIWDGSLEPRPPLRWGMCL